MRGELNVSLPNPVPLGSYKVLDDGIIDFNVFCTEFINWSATLHLIRLDTNECCCLHHSSECGWGEYDYCEDPNYQPEEPSKPLAIDLPGAIDLSSSNSGIQTKEPPPVEIDMGYLSFSSDEGMDFTTMGEAYQDRIRKNENRSCTNNNETADAFQSIRFEPTLLCFMKGFQPSMKSVGLCFSELRLDIWKRYTSGAAGIFDSKKESERHGVTLLHLLDQLKDWQD